MKNRLKQARLLPLSLLERESSFPGKQQLYVLVYYTATTVIGLGTNFFGLSGPQRDFNMWLNIGYIAVAMVLFAGYILHRIRLTVALCGVVMVTQIATSVEMLYCAYTPDEYHLMLIVGNTVLLMGNILLSLIAYLRIAPYIVCGISMATYFACICITGNESLANFFILFLVVFIVACILGSRLVKNIRLLDKENIVLKKDEEEIFNTLGLEKEELKTYMKLAQEKQGLGQTESLLGKLGEAQRQMLIANVGEYLSVKETGMLEMEKLFPELSPSECEVCLLILQGKKLNDICAILGKKESNINSTRTHIRRKLNMQPSDKLNKVLKERVKATK